MTLIDVLTYVLVLAFPAIAALLIVVGLVALVFGYEPSDWFWADEPWSGL